MRSRPASTRRRAGARPTSRHRSSSPITGCRPTATRRSATISPPASTPQHRRPRRERLPLRHAGRAITPYAALQAQSFHTPTYSETDVDGGGFGLTYNTRTAHDIRSELGARFDHVGAGRSGAVLTLRSRLAWAHDWVSDPSLAAAFQALPGASFIVNGAAPAKNSALASAGAELKLANGVTLSASSTASSPAAAPPTPAPERCDIRGEAERAAVPGRMSATDNRPLNAAQEPHHSSVCGRRFTPPTL